MPLTARMSTSTSTSTSTPLETLLLSSPSPDLYHLRHSILQHYGLPDHPSWIRSLAWRHLLYAHNEGRQGYYSLLEDLLPEDKEERYDGLINQIHLDLVRSRYNAFSFFQNDARPSKQCPLAPVPQDQDSRTRSTKRYAILKRLDHMHRTNTGPIAEEGDATTSPTGDASQSISPDHLNPSSSSSLTPSSSLKEMPAIHLSPPTPVKPKQSLSHQQQQQQEHPQHDRLMSQPDRRSHCLLRILFLYAILNPTIGYVQGMVEVASVILWTMGSPTDGQADDSEHFEADTFWCFSSLLGQLKELWDFEGLDHAQAGLHVQNPRESGKRRTSEKGGMARALQHLGARLKWADKDLWRQLHSHGLSPSMPFYAFRWFATLLSTSLPLPSLVRVWDVLLCENDTENQSGRIDFLIDILTSLLISHRGALLQRIEAAYNLEEDFTQEDVQIEAFGSCLAYLQDLPDDQDVVPMLELATMLRQKRAAASMTGEGGPPEDEDEDEQIDDRARAFASLGKQALGAWKGWRTASETASGTTPSPSASGSGSGSGSSWFRSVSSSSATTTWPREKSLPPSPTTPTKTTPRLPSSASGGGIFSKYSQAIQSSDVAAEWSKRGTNWTARALDRWHANQNSSETGGGPTTSRRSASEAFAPPSPVPDLSTRFGSMGASFRRNFSSSITSTSTPPHTPSRDPSSHPAIAFNRENLPNFALPDVMNSPEGRQEYAYFRPQSLMMQKDNHHQQVSPRASPRNGHGLAEEWKFPSSTATATAAATTAFSPNSSSSSIRGAGPKPLLLAGAARAAREDVAADTSAGSPIISKVVRTGPLGGGQSPFSTKRLSNISTSSASSTTRRFATTTKREMTSTSSTSSRQSSSAHSNREESVIGEDSIIEHHSDSEQEADSEGVISSSNSLQNALQTAGAVPKLPSLQQHNTSTLSTQPPSRINRSSDGSSTTDTNGYTATSKDGKISAGAFTKPSTLTTATTTSTGHTSMRSPRLDEDTPLLSESSRTIRRRNNGSTNSGTKMSSSRRKSSKNSSIVTLSSPVVQQEQQEGDGERKRYQLSDADVVRPEEDRDVRRYQLSDADVVRPEEDRDVRRWQLSDGDAVRPEEDTRRYQLSDGDVARPEDDTRGYQLSDGDVARPDDDTRRYQLSDADVWRHSGNGIDSTEEGSGLGILSEQQELSDEPASYEDNQHRGPNGDSVTSRTSRSDAQTIPTITTDAGKISTSSPTMNDSLAGVESDRVSPLPSALPPRTSSASSTATTTTTTTRRPSSTSSSLSSSSKRAKIRSKRSFKSVIAEKKTSPVTLDTPLYHHHQPAVPQSLSSEHREFSQDVPLSARSYGDFPRDDDDSIDDDGEERTALSYLNQDSIDGDDYRYTNGNRQTSGHQHTISFGSGSNGEEGDMLQAISSAFENFSHRESEQQGQGVVRDMAGGVKF
ncbi:unnamed protein product [Sympodiomycopsis kandeliae]